MVKKGVKAQFSSDKSTVTVWCYPSVSGGGEYKLQQKTWKNKCPFCGKKLKFNPKGVAEGELTCSACSADFCGVTGKDKAKKCRRKLTPATTTPNSTTKVASSKTKSQQCSLSKAQALTKAKQLLKTGTGYKSELKIPVLPNIHINDYVSVNLDGFPETKNKQLYIQEYKEDIDNQTLDITLQEGKPYYDTPYNGEWIIKDKGGGFLKASKKNPLQAKCETVNTNIGVKDKSEIGKKIKLKGQSLGTIKKIYKWLRIKSGGGTGGWKYSKYTGHKVSSEKETEWGPKSAKKAWDSKKANCVDFSWIMVKLCEGAGKKMGIRRGSYKTLDGKKMGHMWNSVNGKNYDCSSSTGMTIDLGKVEKV